MRERYALCVSSGRALAGLELQARDVHEVAPQAVEWRARIRLLLYEDMLLVDAGDAAKQFPEVDDALAELRVCRCAELGNVLDVKQPVAIPKPLHVVHRIAP